ncbi:glucosaminidase domain-containing protein [Vagococcus intermedius]|uniref:Peptidoglycan hydrolase n=1 Tax=Vagococcus intermedius TaxID=2991418 RepID=A0AAF0I9R0_9ENTE|nr:glucosaminidase domain-containing protein [Vagococcus intermedius]WEG73652.1 NlpC/P60 family protein [Vagococcus intermedius]WEG75736.1 NlpC/P60 family protein [Vagococcus intermedius]
MKKLTLFFAASVLLFNSLAAPMVTVAASTSFDEIAEETIASNKEETEEEADQKAEEETDQKAEEETDQKAEEETDQKAEEEAEQKAQEEADQKAKEEVEQKAKEEAEQKAQEEAEQKAQEEADQKAKEEAEQKAKEEAEQKAKEEADKQAADQKAKEEADKQAADQKAKEEADKQAADQKAKEEADKQAADQKAKEEADKQVAEQKAKEEADKKAKEEANKQAAEQKAKEEADKKAKEEANKQVAEQKAKEEADKKAKEEANKQVAEQKAKEEADKKAKEEAAKQAAEQKAKEEAAKQAAEQKAKEEAAKQAADQKVKEETARLEKEKQLAEQQARNEIIRQEATNKASTTNLWQPKDGIISVLPNKTSQEFIDAIGPLAAEVAEEYGIYASVMIAQASLESAYGNSALATAPNYNLFGIKGSYEGRTANFQTLEDSGNGSMYSISAGFRKYPSYKESLEDYAKLLKNGVGGNSKFYAGTWKENTDSYKDATKFLTGRYATDTSYNKKLNGIIEAYNLTMYDNGANFKTTKNRYYIVKPHDTLNKIAKKEKVSVKQIMSLNKKIKNPNLIYPKDKLLIEKGRKITKRGKLTSTNDVIIKAREYLGVPYVWGGTTPLGFDCSGIVQYVYRDLGINLPRVTTQQEFAGPVVDFDDMEIGDLLFWGARGQTHHVAFYSGNGQMIMAPEPGDVVKEVPMSSYMPDFAVHIEKNLKKVSVGKDDK